MAAYYNEFDPGAAAWLRELIAEGHIAPGDVDTRSIADVQPDDLKGYTQAHFFAGIGGWSLALRLGGWPDDRPVWTGSCPCQPFSAAGKRKWCPQCLSNDAVPGDRAGVFRCCRCGHEWVADGRHLWPEFRRLIAKRRPPVVFGEQVASKDGRAWLAAVRADLEALGHAVGAADLCSASVGAPNIRQRLWWVGQRLDDTDGARCHGAERWAEGVGDGGLAHAGCEGRQEQWGRWDEPARPSSHGLWSDVDWLPCRDGKARPTQPGLFPLAHGVPGRVGLLRGYGNAINPHVAAELVGAFLDVEAGVSLDLPEPANQSRRFDRTA